MSKNNILLSEDTEIETGNHIPLSKYRMFFEHAIGI